MYADLTINEFEKTGSLIITDGEQSKSSFVTYPLKGLTNLQDGGTRIDFADGHHRQLPLLTSGPFRFGMYAVDYLKNAMSKSNALLQARWQLIQRSSFGCHQVPWHKGYWAKSILSSYALTCRANRRNESQTPISSAGFAKSKINTGAITSSCQ